MSGCLPGSGGGRPVLTLTPLRELAANAASAPTAQPRQRQQLERQAIEEQQQVRQLDRQTSEEEQQHATAMWTAFQHSQACTHAQWDVWAGASLSVLLLLALPSSIQRGHWRTQVAALVAELALRVLPAWLASKAAPSYLPYRAPVVAACRLASLCVLRLAVPPALPAGGWGGWAQLLLLTRALGINTLPWLARLPFKWFVWVHLIGVLDAARSSLVHVCCSPVFTGRAAQQQYKTAARFARAFAGVAPLPFPSAAAANTSCLEALAEAPGMLQSPYGGECACRQMSVWLLACIGYALPVALQFLTETAARRSFYRRHCRRRGCHACAAAKGADLLLLAAYAGLMLAGFCAAAWQLSSSLFVPGGTLTTGHAAASSTCTSGLDGWLPTTCLGTF